MSYCGWSYTGAHVFNEDAECWLILFVEMYQEFFRLLYRGGLTGKFLPTMFFKKRFLVPQALLISATAIMALVSVIWDVWRQKTVGTYEVSTQKTEGAAVFTYQGRDHIRAVQKNFLYASLPFFQTASCIKVFVGVRED